MMDLLIVLAGPVILAIGLYVGDRLITWFGALYTGLFVVAYFTRRYNQARIAKQRADLIERFYDQPIDNDKDNIAR